MPAVRALRPSGYPTTNPHDTCNPSNTRRHFDDNRNSNGFPAPEAHEPHFPDRDRPGPRRRAGAGRAGRDRFGRLARRHLHHGTEGRGAGAGLRAGYCGDRRPQEGPAHPHSSGADALSARHLRRRTGRGNGQLCLSDHAGARHCGGKRQPAEQHHRRAQKSAAECGVESGQGTDGSQLHRHPGLGDRAGHRPAPCQRKHAHGAQRCRQRGVLGRGRGDPFRSDRHLRSGRRHAR